MYVTQGIPKQPGGGRRPETTPPALARVDAFAFFDDAVQLGNIGIEQV